MVRIRFPPAESQHEPCSHEYRRIPIALARAHTVIAARL